MEIKLLNSLSRQVEDFKPINGNVVRMYSCGPTVYNFAHIGNMRAFIFADLLQRVLRTVGGYEVKWVMNITNIDDKTIRDSKLKSKFWKDEMGKQTDDAKENLKKFTDYYEMHFLKDIGDLGIHIEHFYALPKATEFIPQMQQLIRKIVDNGFGYVSAGSVYFNVSEWRKQHNYGRLKKIDFDNFRTGARIDTDQYERDQVSDFVLWKAKKKNEPFWEFEINGEQCPGRPGWHIECSSMEYELLDIPFDIHTGGIDLKFPHHEDEIAQSHAGYGIDPTAFWCHNEFLEVEGKKMSKSLGNFFTLRDLIAKGIDPLDIRFAIMSAHYSSTYNFTFNGVDAARKARSRIQDYIYSLFEDSDGKSSTNIEELRNNVFSELGNDLHTPKALAYVFTFINDNPATELDKPTKDEAVKFFGELNDIFSVWELKKKEVIIPDHIIEIAQLRFEAKKRKDFALADVLRVKINNAGYKIKDTKDSFTIEEAN
jgi:cysteinyl-tRNA synthetase